MDHGCSECAGSTHPASMVGGDSFCLLQTQGFGAANWTSSITCLIEHPYPKATSYIIAQIIRPTLLLSYASIAVLQGNSFPCCLPLARLEFDYPTLKTLRSDGEQLNSKYESRFLSPSLSTSLAPGSNSGAHSAYATRAYGSSLG